MSDTKLCTQEGGDSFGGRATEYIGKPLANLFGWGGQVSDNYTKLQSKLQKVNEKIQTANMAGMTSYLQLQDGTNQQMFNQIQLTSQEMTDYMNYNNTIINDKITINSIYIAGTFCIMMIFLLFYLNTPLATT